MSQDPRTPELDTTPEPNSVPEPETDGDLDHPDVVQWHYPDDLDLDEQPHHWMGADPYRFDPHYWAALETIASTPAPPLLARVPPRALAEHECNDYDYNCDAPGADLLTQCHEELEKTLGLDTPWEERHAQGVSTPRLVACDGGLILGRGRAWRVARYAFSLTDHLEADRAIRSLPNCLILQSYTATAKTMFLGSEMPDESEDAWWFDVVVPWGGTEVIAQYGRALDRRFSTARPNGLPEKYAVQPGTKGARVFAVTPLFLGASALNPIFTAKDDQTAFALASIMTKAIDREDSREYATARAAKSLSVSAAAAVRDEMNRLRSLDGEQPLGLPIPAGRHYNEHGGPAQHFGGL